jgi:hypothetical protein
LITILYFTGNYEDEYFARIIRQNILRLKRDLPIVSVSQKPLDFGKNICVGVHDPCYLNVDRQVQIGLEAIKTEYILTANDDFLYPPEYFSFKPRKSGKCYRYDNVWVHYRGKPFYFKGYSDGAQLIDRELWLDNKNKILRGRKVWSEIDEVLPKDLHIRYHIKTDKKYTWHGRPAIDFKTGHSINPMTEIIKDVKSNYLPYWGSTEDLEKEMFRC